MHVFLKSAKSKNAKELTQKACKNQHFPNSDECRRVQFHTFFCVSHTRYNPRFTEHLHDFTPPPGGFPEWVGGFMPWDKCPPGGSNQISSRTPVALCYFLCGAPRRRAYRCWIPNSPLARPRRTCSTCAACWTARPPPPPSPRVGHQESVAVFGQARGVRCPFPQRSGKEEPDPTTPPSLCSFLKKQQKKRTGKYPLPCPPTTPIC